MERGDNMKSFGGNLTNHGLTSSLQGKNLQAIYIKPKREWKMEEEIPNYKDMSMEELLSLIPKNWHDNSDLTYWEELDPQYFYCKDGQTNVYVKEGMDDEVVDFLERTEGREYVWRIATDDKHIEFISGGKVKVKGREWFILRVISQDGTSTEQNKFNAIDTSYNNKRLQIYGLKTLVLV